MLIFNIIKTLPLLVILFIPSLSLALIDTKEFKLLCDDPDQDQINNFKQKIAQTNINNFQLWLATSNIDSIYKSPLVYAVAKNNIIIIKLLLDTCFKYYINYWEFTTSEGISMLSIAANKQYVDIIEILLKYNHPIYMDRANKTSALHEAAINNNIDIFRMLATKGGHLIHSKDIKYKTPINYLIEHNEVNFVLELLERFPVTSNIFPLDVNGRSYLHYAVKHQIPNLTSYLIAVGFDYKQKDYSGVTPFGFARSQKSDTILQLLESEEIERTNNCWSCYKNFFYCNKKTIGLNNFKQSYEQID